MTQTKDGHSKNFTPYTPKKGEEYMNEAQRAHFKAMLMDWRSELMQEVDRTVNHMKDEAANFPDPADRGTGLLHRLASTDPPTGLHRLVRDPGSWLLLLRGRRDQFGGPDGR